MTSSEGKHKDNVIRFCIFLSIDLTGEKFSLLKENSMKMQSCNHNIGKC